MKMKVEQSKQTKSASSNMNYKLLILLFLVMGASYSTITPLGERRVYDEVDVVFIAEYVQDTTIIFTGANGPNYNLAYVADYSVSGPATQITPVSTGYPASAAAEIWISCKIQDNLDYMFLGLSSGLVSVRRLSTPTTPVSNGDL